MTEEEFTRSMKGLANRAIDYGAGRKRFWLRFSAAYMVVAAIGSLTQIWPLLTCCLVWAAYGRYMAKTSIKAALVLRDGILQDMEKTLKEIRNE